MIVVDASVLVAALADDGSDGRLARSSLKGGDLVAPEIIDLETLAAIRGQERTGHVESGRAQQALLALRRLPLRRAAHRPLLRRCWELRESVTLYDAAYVALAEALGVALLTADARLANATGPRCEFVVLG